MIMQIKWIYLLIVIYVECDFPIHCNQNQIIGSWQFNLQSSTTPYYFSNSCGHPVPDNQTTTYHQSILYLDQLKNQQLIQIELKLMQDGQLEYDKQQINKLINQIIETDGNTQQEQQQYWTMLYDRGMEIRLGRFKMVYYFYYNIDRNDRFYNDCSQTLSGWYSIRLDDDQQNRLDRYRMGCGYGYRTDSKQIIIRKDVVDFMYISNKAIDYESMDVENQKAIKQQQYIVNNHKQNRRRYKRQTRNKNRRNKKLYRISQNELIQKMKQSVGLDYQVDEKYLSRTKDQADCGSCYAISMAYNIEAQIRQQIDTDRQQLDDKDSQQINDQQIEISIQQIISCNYFNQGCDGGTPQLVAKFGQELYLLPAKYYDNQLEETNQYQCRIKLDIKEGPEWLVKVDDYGWVNKVYNSNNGVVLDMMEKIKKYSGVVACYYVDDQFMDYQDGIISQQLDFMNVDQKNDNIKWNIINHSAYIYGWGVEGSTVYWKIINSFGDDWGQKGRLKILAGQNIMGIESHIEWIDARYIRLDDRQKPKAIQMWNDGHQVGLVSGSDTGQQQMDSQYKQIFTSQIGFKDDQSRFRSQKQHHKQQKYKQTNKKYQQSNNR